MPLLRYTKLPSKLPPPPELGEKTLWQYIPRQSKRRVLFLLIALGVVIFLKESGVGSLGGGSGSASGGTWGGLFGAPAPPPRPEAGVYHLKVSRP
jgi:hypothetical protein